MKQTQKLGKCYYIYRYILIFSFMIRTIYDQKPLGQVNGDQKPFVIKLHELITYCSHYNKYQWHRYEGCTGAPEEILRKGFLELISEM